MGYFVKTNITTCDSNYALEFVQYQLCYLPFMGHVCSRESLSNE